MELPKNSDTDHSWQWEESRWRAIVDKVRAGGRSSRRSGRAGRGSRSRCRSTPTTRLSRFASGIPRRASSPRDSTATGWRCRASSRCSPGTESRPPSSCPRWWRWSIPKSSARSPGRGTRSGSMAGSTSSTASSPRPTSATCRCVPPIPWRGSPAFARSACARRRGTSASTPSRSAARWGCSTIPP